MTAALVDGALKALASCFFLSYLPVLWNRGPSRHLSGAGLIGSAAGVATAWAVVLDPLRTALALAGGVALAIAVSDYTEEKSGVPDDPRIVIDEWIGCWLSAAFLPPRLGLLIAAFILFRVFDVWKPLGIRRVARWPGGLGVVADDLLAGVYANIVLQVVHHAGWI